MKISESLRKMFCTGRTKAHQRDSTCEEMSYFKRFCVLKIIKSSLYAPQNMSVFKKCSSKLACLFKQYEATKAAPLKGTNP